MQRSLTKGPITSSILLFALPLMLGSAKKANSTKTETRNLLEPLGSEQVPGFYFCTMLAHFYFATAPFLLCEKAGISLQRPERPFHD